MSQTRSKQGFTLVELSIVLIVIGLIVGGVIAGRSLVRSTHLQSIITDTSKFITAVNQFQKKYQALPGDMATAAGNWGTNANCASNGAGAKPALTCNGNGDGQIYNYNASANAVNSMERYLVWQHLLDAGFITGSYTGVSGSAGNNYTSTIGQNVPSSPVTGAGYDLYYLGNQSGSANFFDKSYGHIIYLGGQLASSPSQAPVLTGNEAAGIDTKMDDGLPGSGNVMSPPQGAATSGSCATTNVATTSAYNLTQKDVRSCALLFVTGF